MDVSTVKAEIKGWERAFKSEHKREATVEDIRKNPSIADKYKLYKKLLKANSSTNVATSATHKVPSTPTRKLTESHQSANQTSLNSFFGEPRRAETTAPLTSYNPFSPQKKGKHQLQTPAKSIKKPFPSPSKFKADSHSADPFVSSLQSQASTSSQKVALASSSISHELSRARKRLRGEPVSPSPNKGKRQRISSQTALPFKPLLGDAHGNLSSEGEENDDLESPFLSNSPVKVPEGGKSFHLLFGEETIDRDTSQLRMNSSLARTQSKPMNRRLFGISDASMTTKAAEDEPLKSSRLNAATSNFISSKVTSMVNEARPRKRSFPDSDTEVVESRGAGPILVPPSPPQQDSDADRGKRHEGRYAKGKKTASRKKPKKNGTTGLDNDEGLSSESSSDTAVRIVDQKYWTSQKHKGSSVANFIGHDEDDPDFDLDPVFTYSRHVVPHGRQSPIAPSQEQDGNVDVDLPDKLRSVLAIQPTDFKTREVREERLVKGLILGRRVENYDPNKGGEIWDVGEDDTGSDGDEVRKNPGGEEDWEGEPIPWEVGEL